MARSLGPHVGEVEPDRHHGAVSLAEQRRVGPARRLLQGPSNLVELIAWWVVTRVITLLVLATPAEHGIIRDVYYYGNQLEAMVGGVPVGR